VKSFTCGLSAFVIVLGLIGINGCGETNETEASRTAKSLGDPGPPDPTKPKVEPSAPPTGADAYGNFGKAASQKPAGYPGVKKQ
jgi:hypothetical protein